MSDVQEPVFDFGAGKTVITTGTHCDYPAVFIEPAKNPGEVGASSKREGAPAGSLVDGGVALRFPTFERARGVANALVGQPSTGKKEPTGWRDIQSAPKHTAVDLLGYYPGRNPKPRRIPDCKLSSSKRWSTKHRDPSGRSLLRANFTPTHWMPLPPPPGEEDLKVTPGSQPHQKAGVALVEVRGCLREIDAEIAPIVSALNLGGVATTASCSGHGNRPGNIILSDGRELIIAQDYEEARLVEGHFPNIHGAWEIHTNPEEAEWSLSERRWNIRLSERLKAAINRIESIAETHPELDLAGDLKFYREVELIGWPSSRTGEEDEPLGRLQRIGQESDQLDTSYQDAHRASVRSTIATSMKREEALQVGYARLAAAATKALKFVEAIETGGRAEGDNYVASGVAALLRSALSTQESGS